MPQVTLPSASNEDALVIETSRELVEIQICAEFSDRCTPRDLTARAARRVELLQERINECATPRLAEFYAAYLRIARHGLEVLEADPPTAVS